MMYAWGQFIDTIWIWNSRAQPRISRSQSPADDEFLAPGSSIPIRG